ncbi:alpha/beta fold hydrolase [Thermodesulfobacteriota bacterium]
MKGYVTTSMGQVHYRTEGKCGEYLVLLHEYPLSSRMFEKAILLLGKYFRVFALDIPGYGESDPPDGSIGIPDYAHWLLEALDTLGVQRFALAGVHTGAAIALELALEAGDNRLTHLILSGIPLLSPEQQKKFLSALEEPDVRADGIHLIKVWQSRLKNYGEDAALDLLQMGAVDILKIYERYHWAYLSVFQYDPGPRLSQVSCPILFLNGEHDRLAACDAEAVKLVKGGTLKIIPGAKGQLPWREPEIYAKEVSAFIIGSGNSES